MKKIIKIDGMICSHCAAGVKRALGGLPGVSGVQVELKEGLAVCEAGPDVGDDALKEAVYDAGFDVVSITTE